MEIVKALSQLRQLAVEAQVQSQGSPSGICHGHSGTGANYFMSNLVLSCQLSLHQCSILLFVIWGWNISPLLAQIPRKAASTTTRIMTKKRIVMALNFNAQVKYFSNRTGELQKYYAGQSIILGIFKIHNETSPF
jgi:hypothetical protein